jgi:hypothetical protein
MSLVPMILTNFTSGELSPRLSGRVDVAKYFNGCQTLENFLVHPHGGITRRSGMRYVADAVSHGSPSALLSFEDAQGQAWVLEFGERADGQGVLRFFYDGGRVQNAQGGTLELSTPYVASHLAELRAVQDRQELILTHPLVAPQVLSRTEGGGFALAALSLDAQPETWGQDNWPAMCCLHEDRLVFAATKSEPFTLWFSRTSGHRDFRLCTREVPLTGWDDFEIADGSGDSRADGRAGDTFLLLGGDCFSQDSALCGDVYDEDGEATPRYYRYTGQRIITASSGSLRATFRDAPSTTAEIESVRKADGALNAGFWEEFEVGARIHADPGSDPLDDDGLEITLSAQQGGRICFLAPRDKLWIGATCGEWTVSGSSLGAPVTPGGVKADRQGTSGAAQAAACPAGHATLYVQRSGRKVREMAYRFESDAYTSRDLTLLSAHVAAPGLTQLAFAQEPDPVLFCVRADGVLVAMTYLPDQDVCAFSRIVTDGAVEAACVVSNDAEGRDELWLVVRRSVPDPADPDGQPLTRRFIETLEPAFSEDAASAAEAFFLDAGLSYAGEPVAELTGLAHLAGRSVQVLADGAVLPERIVSASGSITLPRPASRVHAGLGYTSTLKPMRLEFSGARGSSQTRTKRITEVSVRLHRSLGGKVGPGGEQNGGHLEPLLYRTSADPMDGPPALFTGDKSVRFPQGWGTDGVLTVVQDQPLPMTVLLVAPTLAINE